jgi:taurine dioxygenase
MSSIDVHPVTGVIGADVTGVDPSRPLDDSTVDEIRKAWLDHLVLFFRDVDITPEQQIAFALRFGEIQQPQLRTAHGGPPEMNVLDQSSPKGDGADTWHNDSTYAPDPPMGSVLHVVKSPRFGGDTCFANMYAAYETLSPALRRCIDDLDAVHDIIPQLVVALERGHTTMDLDEARERFPPVRHPVVRTHPETGRPALFVNSNHTTHLADMPKAESDRLLGLLYEHVKSPDLQCRFRWDERSVVFLDNRCTQHYAVPDYHERRVLHRVTMKGERPFRRTPGAAQPA